MTEPINDGGPAFPVDFTADSATWSGMSLRKLYAGLAMQALIQADDNKAWDIVANDAVCHADAMLKRLEQDT